MGGMNVSFVTGIVRVIEFVFQRAMLLVFIVIREHDGIDFINSIVAVDAWERSEFARLQGTDFFAYVHKCAA